MTQNDKDHNVRISHAERRIIELEEEINTLKADKARMAFQLAQCEAALIRLDSNVVRGPYDVDYFSLFR